MMHLIAFVLVIESSREAEESSESKGMGEKDLVLRNLMQRSKYYMGDMGKLINTYCTEPFDVTYAPTLDILRDKVEEAAQDYRFFLEERNPEESENNQRVTPVEFVCRRKNRKCPFKIK